MLDLGMVLLESDVTIKMSGMSILVRRVRRFFPDVEVDGA